MLKLSKYTLFKKDGSKYLLFNTFSKAFLGISFKDGEHKNKIDSLLDGGTISESDHPTGFDTLISQGILTSLCPEDEDKLLENNFYANYFAADVATITLAPSLSCNLNCSYCYQSGYRQDKKNIPPGTAWDENAFEFAKNYIETKRFKKVAFVWFGGEPLLSYRLLQNFSEKIKNHFAGKPVKIKFDIITNGTILNGEVLSTFINLPMESVQITLDGTESSHNKMRPYASGKESYKDIRANITTLLNETKTNIALRFNLSLENNDLAYYTDLISDMTKSFGAFIKNRRLRLEYPVLANDAFSYKNPVSLKQYSKDFIGYLKILSDAGIDKNKTFKYMPPFCTARTANSLVIGPGGDMYKCWEHIGHPDYVIGKTQSGMNKPKDDEWKVIGSHYYPKKCLDCKLLPLCLGGCPLKWGKYKKEPECPFFAESETFWNILKFTNGVVN